MEAWQVQLLTKNLDDLVNNTTCNIVLLTKLKAAGVISQADLQDVQKQPTDLEKSHKLYDILLKKHGSFNIMLQALQDTQQSGAWQILNKNSLNYKFFGAIAYDKTAVIGRGCYNTIVFQGLFDGRKVAVKVVYLGLEIPQSEFSLQEVEFMKQLDDHENVVRYYFAEEKDNSIYIAMELCCTNLQDWVLNKTVQIDKRELCLQATNGLAHIHSHNIIHRDLKPTNILISSRPLVKIADFGLSKRIPWESAGVTAHTSGLGTEGWMAPEVLETALSGHGQKLRTATDMFSLGCIYYFVFTDGFHPFGHHFRRQGNILDNKPEFMGNASEMIPTEYFNLVKELIVPDPQLRPTATTILKRLLNKDLADPNLQNIPTKTSNLEEVFRSDEPSIEVYTDATEQPWGMEPYEAEFIIENIFKLVMCTTVNAGVLGELIKAGIISNEEENELMELRSQTRSLKLYILLLTRQNSYETLQNILEKAQPSGALQILASICDRQNTQQSERKGTRYLIENIVKNIYSGEMENKMSQAETLSNESIKLFHKDACENIKLLCLESKLVKDHEWNNVVKYLDAMFYPIYYHIPTTKTTSLPDKIPTIGIDLGTKKCVVGLYIKNKVQTLEFESQTNFSSYTAFRKENKIEVRDTTIVRETQNISLASNFIFPLTLDSKNIKLSSCDQGSEYHHEDIFAILLEHCKQEAEKVVGLQVTNAVISVSTYFNKDQRDAIISAGKRVGFDLVYLLNDSLAAAIAYRHALITPKISKILVFDIGAGTFGTAVIEFRDDRLVVKSYGSDARLAGEDIDILLANYCLENFWRKTDQNFQSKNHKYGCRNLALLKESCERVKVEMSSHLYATDVSSVSIANFYNGRDLFVTISLSMFEELISPIIEKMMKIVKETLDQAKTRANEIEDIALIGGTTCIPRIKNELSKIFRQKSIYHVINPNIAVAYGATIKAAILSWESSVSTFGLNMIQDVFPMSICIEDYQSFGENIRQNTRYPYNTRFTFHSLGFFKVTSKEIIKIYEYDYSSQRRKTILGKFKISGFPMAIHSHRTVNLKIEMNHLGSVHVTATRSNGLPLQVKNVTK